MKLILLDGRSLTRVQLEVVAYGAPVALDEAALERVAHAARFLAEQVRREEPIYGVSTGFGSNADRLLGAHPLRDDLPGAVPSGRSLHAELQRNLIISHAVCVGEPFAPDVVRAMLCIRINTLLRGHSGVRVETLQALTAMLNAGVVPVVAVAMALWVFGESGARRQIPGTALVVGGRRGRGGRADGAVQFRLPGAGRADLQQVHPHARRRTETGNRKVQ